ncbi:MAG TPA: hypothetical protein VJ378_01080, partial [Candidatus Paceibacterota bacterium]|nr:hypothetical protein [Candidatus Paceibacterota bacterium]
MATLPKKIISKDIIFQSKDLENRVAQVNVCIGNDRKINLIIDNEVVLRFDNREEKKDNFLEKLKISSFKNFK